MRMEGYRGLAVLTSNLRKALDPAFLRRLRFVVDFPFPGVEERIQIWRRVIPDRAPPRGWTRPGWRSSAWPAEASETSR